MVITQAALFIPQIGSNLVEKGVGLNGYTPIALAQIKLCYSG